MMTMNHGSLLLGRTLQTVNRRTRTVGCAVRQPYSDSEDSDNDVLYAE